MWIDNIVLVLGIQQSDSVIYVYVSIFSNSHYRLLQDIEYSLLCYIVNPCYLSILCIVVCVCCSHTPNLSLLSTLSLLVTISLFPMSLYIFCFHWLNGHEFEQTLGHSEGHGSLACCSPWDHKESDTTQGLNNNILFNLHFSIGLFVLLFIYRNYSGFITQILLIIDALNIYLFVHSFLTFFMYFWWPEIHYSNINSVKLALFLYVFVFCILKNIFLLPWYHKYIFLQLVQRVLELCFSQLCLQSTRNWLV